MERGGGIPPLFCQDIKRKKGKKLMNWKFWKTDSKNGQSLNQRSSNLPKPKDLPTRVGIYLVTQLKLDPDWVWTLQGVVRPTTEKHNFEIRIFDPKEAVVSDVVVRDFNSLDDCLEMVLFEGCFNKETGWVDIKRTADKAA
jgi:hypothetical protein